MEKFITSNDGKIIYPQIVGFITTGHNNTIVGSGRNVGLLIEYEDEAGAKDIICTLTPHQTTELIKLLQEVMMDYYSTR